VAAGCFAGGLAVSPFGAVAFLVAALALAALVSRAGHVGGLSVALLVAGGLLGEARLAAIDSPSKGVRDGAAFEAPAFALSHPRPSPFGASVELAVAGGHLKGARLLVRIPRWAPWPRSSRIGAEVMVRGRLRRLRPGSGREFDFAAHLRRRGIAGELLLEGVRPTGRARGGLSGAIDRMRRRSERALAAGMPGREAALARGMVLGQDERIEEPLRDAFRASGLAHLLAVSGQNVMLLVALALPALVAAGASLPVRYALLLGLIAIYVPLAGAGPSLQRAGVMGAAGIAALAASRPASRAYALLLAAAVTLAVNPLAAGDPGWQLSFAAVAGIIWLVPPLAGRLADGGPRAAALRALAEGAAITVAATVATAPLLAHHFGSVPLAGLPANLVALPAVAPAMWTGMAKAALGQLSAAGWPLANAAGLLSVGLGRLARAPVAYIAWLAERFAEMPGGQIALPLGSPAAVALAYALLGAGALCTRRAARGLPERIAPALARWRRLPPGRRVAVASLLAAAFLLAGAHGLSPPPPPDRITVRFLDVGQGDATLVQQPDGSAILFDGGPPEAGVAGMLRRFGVRRLSLLVATHASRDHHGGLREVLARYPVGLLLDGGDGSRDRGFREVLAEARQRKVRRVAAVAPLSLGLGAVTVDVLSPFPRPPGPPPDDPNPRGVVAVVRIGDFDLLLSADAEGEALAPQPLGDVDAMKVPHHGSSDPGLPDLLRRLRPELAAIEVGPNTYGHPAPSTLAALRRAGVRTLRTDRHGTVTLTPREGGFHVAARARLGRAWP
jgi:competence protein ComEC